MPRSKKDKTGSVKSDPLYSSDDFRMYCFKVMPCSRHYTHDWTECPFAHPGEKAKRRDPRLYSYVGIECPHVKGESNKCPRGDMCPFAHNVFECWLHPSRYRTQMCNEPATCRRKICFFAHSQHEMREPTPVSKDVNINVKQGPRRVSTTSSDPKSSPSPRLQLEKEAVKSQTRASFDIARKPPPVEVPRRASVDFPASRGVPPLPTSQSVSSQPQQPNNTLFSLISLLQQPQQPAQVQQQLQQGLQQQLHQGLQTQLQQQLWQQQIGLQRPPPPPQSQMKTDVMDSVAAALSHMSLGGASPQGPALPQQNPTGTVSVDGTGSSDQWSDIVKWYLQQQSLSTAGNLGMNPQQPSFALDPANVPVNYPGLPSMSHSLMLQHQIQQLQNLSGFGNGGVLRSSFDSTLSSGSGRIPARISFDNVTSTASMVQHGMGYLNAGSLQPGLFGAMSNLEPATDCVIPGAQTRSSTDSSAAESFGCYSSEALPLDMQSSPVEFSAGLSNPSTSDDFISCNLGTEGFITANTVAKSTAGSAQP